MKVNIIDPGSAKRITEKKQDEGSILDVIGLSSRVHEPIGSCYVAQYTMNRGNDVRVIIPKSSNLSVEEILSGNPGLVAFSSLTYSYPLALEAARRVKEKNKGITTVIGGYHATCVPQEVSEEPAFDFVVPKEGDWTLADIIEYLEGRRQQKEIRGIVYQNGKLFVDNFQRFDPNDNPIPFRDKEMVSGLRRFGLYYPAPSDQRSIILLVGSRGCNYGCKFCISSEMFPSDKQGVRTRYRNIGNIIQEIEQCQSNFGTNYGFFVDLNFYGGNKERVKELCKALSKTGFRWYAMSRVDVDPEILEDMHRGGCTQVGFGVESLTKPLKAGFVGTQEDWKELVHSKVKLLKGMGMLSKGYFIVGDYTDTRESLEAERQEILESGFDELRLSFMTYSPGTPLFEKLKRENGFVTNDFSLFSTDFPVVRVRDMTPEQILKFRMDTYRAYYTSEKYKTLAKSMAQNFPYLQRSFSEFNTLLKSNLGEGFD